ncbi:MAG: hypothetical protein KC419_26565, partial [Anaerolineales bacterium]|nr:hypothetical protein [Anaerolineales bacterium]
GQVRDRLFELAGVQRHHLVLDVHAGTGLLTWEAVRQAPEGGVWALTSNQQAGEALRQQAERLPEMERPFILIGSLDELAYLMALRGDEDVRFDRVLARNLFTQDASGVAEMGGLVKEWLGENGRFCLAQTIPQHGQRLYNLIDWQEIPTAVYDKVRAVEEAIYSDPDSSMTNWDESRLEAGLRSAGFARVQVQLQPESQQRRITEAHLQRWFGEADEYAAQPSYAQRLRTAGITENDVNKLATLYRKQLQDQVVSWYVTTAYLIAA